MSQDIEFSTDGLTLQQAHAQYRSLSTIVLLNVPPLTCIGLDLFSFTTTAKVSTSSIPLVGIKYIPNGPHILHWTPSSTSKREDSFSLSNLSDPIRTSTFLYIDHATILVLKWNEQAESLIKLSDPSEHRGLESAVLLGEFDQLLGPYPKSEVAKWVKISSHISNYLIEHLKEYDTLLPHHLPYSVSDKFENGYESKIDQNHNLNKPQILQRSSHYTVIPSVQVTPDLQPSEITNLYHDKSKQLQLTLDTMPHQPGGDSITNLLGEFQYAFLSFYIGHDYEAYEQWKRLTLLFSQCDDAIEKLPNLFDQFTTILLNQLLYVPSDFFIDPLSSDNFLRHALRSYITICDFSEISETMKNRITRLKKLVQDRFGWDSSRDGNNVYDDDEYAPVIVESTS